MVIEMIKKLELIEDWKKAYKLWCTWINVIGATIMGWFLMWPDSVMQIWAAMPDEAKAFLPQNIVPLIAMILFVGSTIARIVKQKKLQDAKDNK